MHNPAQGSQLHRNGLPPGQLNSQNLGSVMTLQESMNLALAGASHGGSVHPTMSSAYRNHQYQTSLHDDPSSTAMNLSLSNSHLTDRNLSSNLLNTMSNASAVQMQLLQRPMYSGQYMNGQAPNGALQNMPVQNNGQVQNVQNVQNVSGMQNVQNVAPVRGVAVNGGVLNVSMGFANGSHHGPLDRTDNGAMDNNDRSKMQFNSSNSSNASHASNNGNNVSNGSQSHNNPLFLNPFYGNSYPMTNPPLFDSTMLLPFGDGSGPNRRRRISISNGQIGQIVNHEAFFLDEDSMEEFYEHSRQIRPHSPNTPDAPPPAAVQDDTATRFARNTRSVMPVGASRQDNPMGFNDLNEQAQIVSSALDAPKPEYSSQPQLLTNLAPGSAHLGLDASRATPASENSGVAGVPPGNYSLIYNNEVIFNPNNGPIPGTAAWKKERLLERNRVAASKCRQRKKHAQQQLQDNMNKVEKQVKEKEALLDRYSSLFDMYNTALRRHFNGEEGVLDSLRQYIDNPILDFSADTSAISS